MNFSPPDLFWPADVPADAKDAHVAFRADFSLEAAAAVEFQIAGAPWFAGWIDGRFFCEGPARFTADFPEWQTWREPLAAGRHTLAFQVHQLGVSTRMLAALAPFFGCTARAADRTLPLHWKCARLAGYASGVRRINPQLGFIEWCDTRETPAWREAGFDDRAWAGPSRAAGPAGAWRPLSIANPQSFVHALHATAAGELVERFGYERDDPAARFFLRELTAGALPVQGVWRRYDLGRVRLMRPRFELDLPAGAVVEFAYAEALSHGRVAPWIPLSAGESCNLDHYAARGDRQEFFPLVPRGGRFLEVHVLAPPAAVKFLREEAVERSYYGAAAGSLRTGDAQLDRIWSVGVETHRACAEDALTDNPVRERGQWAGDVVTVGLDIAAAAFADLRLCRRGLVQCAQCARADGLVAGLCPGGTEHLTTYAAQWLTACVHYWELTGERALLAELWPAAERNAAAFLTRLTADGLPDGLGWGFVDWGYVRNSGPSDMGVNLHLLAGLRDLVRWAGALGHAERAVHYEAAANALAATVGRYFATELAAGGDAWTRIGYHRAALGHALGFFDARRAQDCREFLQAHWRRCFPNDPSAPRLSDPGANHPQLVTPYFGHYALPCLIGHGSMDFVLEQYRACWGWMLGDGRTTWLEVFDPRWSHCHQWSGCPTWQLSRCLLGLRPRRDLGENHHALMLATGSLTHAEGTLPLPGRDGAIRVAWEKDARGLHYRLETPEPLVLRLPARLAGGAEERLVPVEREFAATWPAEACV